MCYVLSRSEYTAALREHLDPPGSGKAAALARHLGHQTTAQVSRWKRGGMPALDVGPKLADYFGDERLRDVPQRNGGISVGDAGLLRLLALLREAVSVLEQALDEDRPQP